MKSPNFIMARKNDVPIGLKQSLVLVLLTLLVVFLISWGKNIHSKNALTSVVSGNKKSSNGRVSENRVREILYNGIELPAIWPPKHFTPESNEPMPVPYLQSPPKVVSIDLGRQLFVDDFLIEYTNLERKFYRAEKFSGNPVFKPMSADEKGGPDGKKSVVYFPNGGIFYDWSENVFKMFYSSGWLGGLALATSKDMINWNRPNLGLYGGNLLLPKGPVYTGAELLTAGSNNSIWLDMEATDSRERIKFLTCWIHVPDSLKPKHTSHTLHVSNGKTWSKGRPTGIVGDLSSIFYNPFRKVWVSSIRKSDGPRGRCRYYSESTNFLDGADWSKAVYWTNADRLDKPEPKGGYPGAGDKPQLYSLNAVAYESILVGMHYILRGPQNAVIDNGKFPKLTDLELGFSRDGFHWSRPDRGGFIKAARKDGSWDRGYLRSPTGVFVIMDDKLVFPFTGFSGVAEDGSKGPYCGASIGMAFLRRDGFASMDASTINGVLTTRPLLFSGKHLFINAKVPNGYLRAEVRDMVGSPIFPFTINNSIPFTGNSTSSQMRWKTEADLSSLAGKPIRFHFELSNGSFFAFWISKNKTGRSDGFVAAGGPGYNSVLDTVGNSIANELAN